MDPSEWKLWAIVLELEEILGIKVIAFEIKLEWAAFASAFYRFGSNIGQSFNLRLIRCHLITDRVTLIRSEFSFLQHTWVLTDDPDDSKDCLGQVSLSFP